MQLYLPIAISVHYEQGRDMHTLARTVRHTPSGLRTQPMRCRAEAHIAFKILQPISHTTSPTAASCTARTAAHASAEVSHKSAVHALPAHLLYACCHTHRWVVVRHAPTCNTSTAVGLLLRRQGPRSTMHRVLPVRQPAAVQVCAKHCSG